MIDIPLLRRKNGLDRGLVVGSIAIGGSWLYLNRAALYWLATSIVDISLFNGAILVAGALLLTFLGWHYRRWRSLSPGDSIELAPGLYRLPLLLIFGCSVATISTQWLRSGGVASARRRQTTRRRRGRCASSRAAASRSRRSSSSCAIRRKCRVRLDFFAPSAQTRRSARAALR